MVTRDAGFAVLLLEDATPVAGGVAHASVSAGAA